MAKEKRRRYNAEHQGGAHLRAEVPTYLYLGRYGIRKPRSSSHEELKIVILSMPTQNYFLGKHLGTQARVPKYNANQGLFRHRRRVLLTIIPS